ncbi:MAG: hypothetical protein HUJ53_02895, partial [Holdemanella sp.]|nr:hypothetical protein [Holdemanella sp.]
MDRYLKEERIIENLENRNLKEAFSLIEDYHSLYGKTDFYYLALSDYYIFNHEYNKVIKLLNQALESGLESNEVYERLADAYFGLERYDIVLEYIEKCDLVQDNPNYIRLFELGGFCNFKLGNYKEAIQYYEDVLMEDQNSFPAYLFGGISYYMMGDKETGIHYLAKVLHQCDERTMYSLSGIVSDLNRLDLIEDMETIIPDVHKHFIHYMKGYYYVNANQLKEAISQFRMFLRKVDSYEISIELAKLYHYTEDEQRCQDILHDLYDGLPPMEDVPFYEENILFLLEMISYIDLKREEK